jgi:UDP-glucuronate decarboxylase
MFTKKLTTAAEVIESDIKAMLISARLCLDKISNKNILITGGGGFLGYYFINLFIAHRRSSGCSLGIYVLENFIRGRPVWLEALTSQGHINIIEADISKNISLDKFQFDYIIHAASIASPSYYRMFPIETIDANVNGIRSLLEYSKNSLKSSNPVKGLLYFSTSEIYGDPSIDAIPTKETYRGNVSCTGPRACYDESKRLGETLCVNFSEKYSVPVTIARPFNNYGPGLSAGDKRLLPDIASNIFSGRDIVLHSDGKATRTFCYITDAINGYLRILTFGKSGEPYNIGTDSPEVSVIEFTRRIVDLSEKFFDYSGQIIYKASVDVNYLVDNPNRRCPDLNKARNTLGYYPKISLEDGLFRSLLWYRENME